MEVSDFFVVYYIGKKVMCNIMWLSVDDIVKVMLYDEWEWIVGVEVVLVFIFDVWRLVGEIKLYRFIEFNVVR